jgi:hypothetical protein
MSVKPGKKIKYEEIALLERESRFHLTQVRGLAGWKEGGGHERGSPHPGGVGLTCFS